MSANIGDRVGAILSQQGLTVYFLGYGVYEGDFVPPADVNPLLNQGRKNPKIRLDNGKTVWGCECWWGPEERIKGELANPNLKVVEVDIDEERKRYQEALK